MSATGVVSFSEVSDVGTYLNPGNSGFSRIRNDIYVDKSGLIALINDTIDTTRSMTCVSRPRRFGKSFAAQMLCAYYDKTCDSQSLFKDLNIARSEDYKRHINRYDVIYIDMTGVSPFTSRIFTTGKNLSPSRGGRTFPRTVSPVFNP